MRRVSWVVILGACELLAYHAAQPSACKCQPSRRVEREPFSAPEQPDTWPEPAPPALEQVSLVSAPVSVSASFTVATESLKGVNSGPGA
jgi:hypothetical protein